MTPQFFIVMMMVCAFFIGHKTYRKFASVGFVLSGCLYMGWLPFISNKLLAQPIIQTPLVQETVHPHQTQRPEPPSNYVLPPYPTIYLSKFMGRKAALKTIKGDFSMRPKCTEQNCLHLKSKKAISGGASHEGLYALAASIQNSVPGFIYFSAFNGQYHQDRYCSKNTDSTVQHCYGRALDFTVIFSAKPKKIFKAVRALMPAEVRFKIKHMTRCNGCTGEHFHLDFSNDDDAAKALAHAIKTGSWVAKVKRSQGGAI